MAAGLLLSALGYLVDRNSRLRESYEIQQTRSAGKSAANGPLVARILPNKLEPARNRYTVIAGKRVGKSHDRNRCKRVTREALRHFDPRLKQGFDIAVIIRGRRAELSDLQVAQRSLGEIFRKSNLLLPT